MIIKLLGKRWRLEFVARMQDDGKCDPPDKEGKTIMIARRLQGERQLETLIHEMLHACMWYVDESHVTAMAADIARALWRLGYRKTGNQL